MTPNISLIIINRFSIFYGGDQAVAVYACISYHHLYRLSDFSGSGRRKPADYQPLLRRKRPCPAEKIRKLAYGCGIILAAVSCVILYGTRDLIGILFGSSAEVNAQIGGILPIFLISVPFVSGNPCNYCKFLRNRRKYSFLYSDLHRACAYAASHACPAPSFWRTDHDLVEHCNCQNPGCGSCPDFKTDSRQTETGRIKHSRNKPGREKIEKHFAYCPFPAGCILPDHIVFRRKRFQPE